MGPLWKAVTFYWLYTNCWILRLIHTVSFDLSNFFWDGYCLSVCQIRRVKHIKEMRIEHMASSWNSSGLNPDLPHDIECSHGCCVGAQKHARMCAHVCTCRGQRRVVGVFFYCSPTYFFKMGIFIEPNALFLRQPGLLPSCWGLPVLAVWGGSYSQVRSYPDLSQVLGTQVLLC